MSARPAGRKRLLIAAALASITLVAAPAATQAGAAQAASKSSWKTERTEEFSGKDLPAGCGPYGGPYAGGRSAWSSKSVDIDDGLLKLGLARKKTSGRPLGISRTV